MFMSICFLSPAQNKFNDITYGDNNCKKSSSITAYCCVAGFSATTGWDPVTGGQASFGPMQSMNVHN